MTASGWVALVIVGLIVAAVSPFLGLLAVVALVFFVAKPDKAKGFFK